jgi:hypothetical protein
VYFGDSIRSDVFPSKVHANWETVLILEELEAEGMQKHQCKIRHDHNDDTSKDGVDDDDAEPIEKKMKSHIKVRIAVHSTPANQNQNNFLYEEFGSKTL